MSLSAHCFLFRWLQRMNLARWLQRGLIGPEATPGTSIVRAHVGAQPHGAQCMGFVLGGIFYA
jgi:hypothetical protein